MYLYICERGWKTKYANGVAAFAAKNTTNPVFLQPQQNNSLVSLVTPIEKLILIWTQQMHKKKEMLNNNQKKN